MVVLLIIFILITSEVSLILAQIGRFSLWAVLPGLVTALFLLPRFLRGAKRAGGLSKRYWQGAVIALIIAAGLILFFRPYEYLDGGWDPGNYINTGVHLARTGGLAYYDDTLKETAGLVRANGTGIKCPGLYIKDIEKGLVVPQFFYLFPVWIALFYKLFGLKAVFYLNPFFALLSVILILLIGNKTMGRKCGWLAAFLLCFNTIQIWNARFSTAEVLAQFLFLAGIYFWLEYLANGRKTSAFWAGVCFGEFLLTSITSILLAPVMVIYLLYRSNKRDLYFVIPFVFLICHLAVQLSTYSSVYLESIIMFFRRREIYAGIILTLAALGVIALMRNKILVYLRYPFMAAVVLLFLYGYFIRPNLSSSVEYRNLVELGNWLSLAGLAGAVLGLLLIVKDETNEGVFLFVLTALMFAAFFIYNKRMFSRYPFALRRYIPTVVPAYCFCVSYLCCYLGCRLKRWGWVVSIVLVLVVSFVPLARCRDILAVRDHSGWLRLWDNIAGNMDDDGIYIVDNYRWARPLADIYGKQVINLGGRRLLRERGIVEIAGDLIRQGRKVYYLSVWPRPYSLSLDFGEVYRRTYRGPYLEDSLAFPPVSGQNEFCFRIYRITSLDGGIEKEYTVDIGENEMGLLWGFDRARSFSGFAGTARWTFDRARMVIPWNGDNISHDLILRAKGMPPSAGKTIISVYIEDQPVAEDYAVDEEMTDHIFHIPAGTVNTGRGRRRVVLTLYSTTWDPDNYGITGYPDGLGVLIDEVVIIAVE